jgi:hypothetical protein
MKSVIMIAYDFPPVGHAGSYRPLRFVQHLPARGWHPTVVTLENHSFRRYDPSLLAEVPTDVRVVRVPNRDPWLRFREFRVLRNEKKMAQYCSQKADRIRKAQQAPLRCFARKVLESVEAWCYHPDPAMGWIRPAVKAVVELCAENKPDILWATGGPWSSFIVAQRASQQTAIPYVMDFRDSWTLSYTDFDLKRPSWAIHWDRRTLYNLFERAQGVVFRYHSEAECYWRAYRNALKASKIHIIPNGYSGRVDESVGPDGDKCTVLYVGTLASYSYDGLLQAVKQLKKSDPSRASQLRFVFVGEGTEALADQAAKAEVSDMIETLGPVPHSKVLELQQNAHVLLLLGLQPARGYELCGGSKVFGYLKANRPIFGIVSPADEVRTILQSVGVSTLADTASVCEIVAALRRLLDSWSAGTLATLVPNRAACAIYSAERQTADLARALERLPAAEAFIPGSAGIPPSLRDEITQETGSIVAVSSESASR